MSDYPTLTAASHGGLIARNRGCPQCGRDMQACTVHKAHPEPVMLWLTCPEHGDQVAIEICRTCSWGPVRAIGAAAPAEVLYACPNDHRWLVPAPRL